LTRCRGAALLLGAFLSFVSCRQIIGIEGAEVNPSLAGGGSDAAPQVSAISTASAGAAAIQEYAGAGGDMGQAGTSMSTCEQYCSAVMSNCTGAFAVYTSYDTCLSVCVDLPAGQPGDRNINSVQCRLHAALIAGDEVPHYCPIAGPGGNGECGTNCEGLCGLRAQICAQYADVAVDACLRSCSQINDLGTYSTDPNLGQYGGPHVQCRLYHVSAAAVDDAEDHCLHVDGASPCR
jgi:hypothetical protein